MFMFVIVYVGACICIHKCVYVCVCVCDCVLGEGRREEGGGREVIHCVGEIRMENKRRGR